MGTEFEYLPLRRRGQTAAGLLFAHLVMGLVSIPVEILEYQATRRAPGGELSDQATAMLGVFALVQLVIIVATAIGFCMWLYRARRNILALGVPGLYYSPGYSVGSFFIPFANLIVPFRAMKEAWKATEPPMVVDSESWKAHPVSAILGLWWTTWLLSSIFGYLSLRTTLENDPEMSVASGVLSTVLSILSAVFAMRIVRTLTRRIESAAGQESVP